jgi:hypothetical protein
MTVLVGMRLVGVLTVSVLILGGAGCASTDTPPAAVPGHELRPHAVGWERFSSPSTGSQGSGGAGRS